MARERGKQGEPPSPRDRPGRSVGPEGPDRPETTGGPEAGEAAEGDGGARGAIPELMRKALSAGVSGFLLTEETLRRTLGESLPKEWSEFAAEQSRRAQSELMERLGAEFGRALEGVDPAQVLSRLLAGHTVEVKAEIRLRRDAPTDAKDGDRTPDPAEDEGAT